MKGLFSPRRSNGVSNQIATSIIYPWRWYSSRKALPPTVAARATVSFGPDTDGFLAQAPTNPSPAPPPKKDPQMPQVSPLEKRLQDMGPIRGDGSDKFFGMENVRLLPHSGFYHMRPIVLGL